ncbi:hypothetical protein FGSG_13029 [Fusarium graminearum PH-1]|uniref:Chromosome 4, complete genome n=2 Tax=Gibberella zeae TaxID=5518 RepID=I1S853_GIBZE|nr:hypothetical protein FGSG_13029 [Fusarium graminearum PH-1]ESU13126.1 hypothetical protein FGSG_13029 [Fusarium graminearum PH-1]EYB23849.1 hypothetical protein FG05_13029 [Fusarium graminearum]CEF83709.1 unnamed protein product [Fusarium graminearum]|eukprot:XP_011326633.1 hypothetical protein FGSG_13029 [Fusarium graminearum PH-1]
MTSYDSDSRVGTSTKQKTWQPTRTVTYRTTPQTIARFSGIDHRNSWIIARVVAFSSQFVSECAQPGCKAGNLGAGTLSSLLSTSPPISQFPPWSRLRRSNLSWRSGFSLSSKALLSSSPLRTSHISTPPASSLTPRFVPHSP